MSPGATFERVYRALKAQLASGRWPPGERLEPAALSGDFNASITPVRDALHRLVGERLVEAPRQNGFRVRDLTEAQLRDLYDWNEALLALALHIRARPAPAPGGSSEAPTERPTAAADFFRDIARLSQSAEHLAAIESLNDRLAAMRITEGLVLQNAEQEVAGLQAAWADGDPQAFRRALRLYHQRRKACVPELISAARQPRD